MRKGSRGKRIPIEERFWKYVDRRGPAECWLWKGSIPSNGYGQLFNPNAKHKHETAPRISYRIHYGEPPAGALICHTCDVRACVNPKHLFLGTSLDNVHDAMAKGRMKKPPRIIGMRNHSAKLTDEFVREMRKLAAEGATATELAKGYGVTQAVAYNAIKGISWRHIT